MKKISIVLLTLLLVICCTGCSSSKLSTVYNKYKNNQYVTEITNENGKLNIIIVIGDPEIDSSISDKDQYVIDYYKDILYDILDTLEMKKYEYGSGYDPIEGKRVLNEAPHGHGTVARNENFIFDASGIYHYNELYQMHIIIYDESK